MCHKYFTEDLFGMPMRKWEEETLEQAVGRDGFYGRQVHGTGSETCQFAGFVASLNEPTGSACVYFITLSTAY